MNRLPLALAALLPLAAVAQTKAPPPPTLVVFLTVDQMRADYFPRFLPQLTGGLGRLYRRGAVFTQGYQDHAITETAPGHAAVLSGRFPRHTGIVANSTGVLDVQTPLIAMNDTGASPFRFRGSTLIDWMRVRDWRSRALSVSRKDRAAILPIGRAHQTAVWFVANGNFTTSTYYSDTLPTWLTEFNAKRLPLSFAGQSWTPLLPDSAYPEPDSVAVEGGGKDYVFPHKLPRDSTVTRALAQTPMMDQLTLEVALAGVRAMRLGEGPVPDLLQISLSTTDAVGHRYGPDSKELHDQIVRLDRYLGAFLDSLYSMRDSTRVIIALTADHGVAPFPEVHSGRYPNTGAGYVNITGFFEYIRQALPRHGVDTTAWRFSEGCLYVDKDRIRAGGLNPDSLVRVFSANVRALPGVARTDIVRTLAQHDTVHDFIARRWFHMFPDDVAPELVVTLKPYWYWGEPGGSASHGSVYDYDAWVPILFYGPGFKPGKYTNVVRVVDMAPTLAVLVGAKPSERLDGHVLWKRYPRRTAQPLSQPPDGNLLRAFDEARFGSSRTLNLREGPTGEDAARRAEAWLRERQVTAPGEDVLVITGRGKGSTDGVPVIREAIVRLFPVLRRRGVIVEVREHTAGAFIVRLATLRELVDAPRRNRRRTPPPVPRDPAVLKGLDPDVLEALRRLADKALDAFGVSRRTPSFVDDEMVRQFTRLVGSIAEGPDRDMRLRQAIEAALEEYE